MTNVQTELLKEIKDAGKVVSDVVAFNLEVNTDDVRVSHKGANLSEVLGASVFDVEYYAGYGLQELFGLVLFSDNTWLERSEYDGSESWVYKRPPTFEEVMRF